jgi:hypothetical protein
MFSSLKYCESNRVFYFRCMDKLCYECGTEIKGRVDKKFCDDSCRSAFNNKINNENNALVKKVNKILRKNRTILFALNPDGKAKTNKSHLMRAGFNFEYFTHTYTTKEGKTYYFCYEQGYLPLENDWYFLVVREEN